MGAGVLIRFGYLADGVHQRSVQMLVLHDAQEIRQQKCFDKASKLTRR
jgi:hypothetical protein